MQDELSRTKEALQTHRTEMNKIGTDYDRADREVVKLASNSVVYLP